MMSSDEQQEKKSTSSGIIDINNQNNSSDSPLHAAIWEENLPEVKKLLDDPNTVIDAEDKNGCRPLHIAAKVGHREILAIVLIAMVQKQIVLDTLNKAGKTARNIAEEKGDSESVKLIDRAMQCYSIDNLLSRYKNVYILK